MSHGAGKYDDECTQARATTEADGVVLIVLNGKKGSGFSVQAPGPVLEMMPDMLEGLAQQIREDLKPKGNA